MRKKVHGHSDVSKTSAKNGNGDAAPAKSGHSGSWTLAEDTARFTERLRSRDRIVEKNSEIARRTLVGAGIMLRSGKLAKPYR